MSFKNVAENDFVVVQLLTFTHYHFLFSTACQTRCHLSDAFASARAAIDGALIGAHIIHDRASKVAYAKREKPFDNFARYLGNLIKDKKETATPLVPALFNQHKVMSRFASHADGDSFVHRITKSTQDDQMTINIEYFQFARNDAERKIHALTLFHTFVMTLDIFAEFLVVEQKVVPAQWQQELYKLGQSIEGRVKELKASLPPDPEAIS